MSEEPEVPPEDDPPEEADPERDEEPEPESEPVRVLGCPVGASGVGDAVVADGEGEALDGLGDGDGACEADAETEAEGDGFPLSPSPALGWQPVRASNAAVTTAAADREARWRALVRITEGESLQNVIDRKKGAHSVRAADLMSKSLLWSDIWLESDIPVLGEGPGAGHDEVLDGTGVAVFGGRMRCGVPMRLRPISHPLVERHPGRRG
ncbi:hypothetical protein MOV08_38295 [Streptomyces yunnanensis]|uniref:Uncharacterized protein n=1 Tax=Streptomyces yunnanensis TaxID=156453 RepID=A0ABY8AHP4_9ACTN|nr:hypothetical protein [Streptomyces yunnanensis]WEB44560.1 hypothetical protein MOV08_38295 [Streptomyces yunnanensis]